MSKVLIDRELLAKHVAEIDSWNASMEKIIGRQPGYSWTSLESLREAIAQPAEAEGVQVWGKLKRLAEAQPVKEWGRTEGRMPMKGGREQMFLVSGPEHVSDYEDWGFTRRSAAFIAAANPANVLELIATLSAVTAEVEGLRKDAERYRMFRRGMFDPDRFDADIDAVLSAQGPKP